MKRLVIIFFGILVFQTSFSQEFSAIQRLEVEIIKNQYDSAIVIANNFLEIDTSNWLVYFYLGKSYQSKYKFFDALKAFEKANELDSANFVIENALAVSYDFIGKDEDAIDIYYNQYLRDTSALEPILSLASIFKKKKEYASAIHYFQKAVATDPANFYYHKQLAFCYDKINIAIGAIYTYKVALMLNPYDVSMYIQLANILNKERGFIDAIETCNQGLKIYDDNIQILKIRSYSYYLNREFDSSIVGFNKLLELGDTSYFNIKYQGLAFFEKREFVKAIENLTIAQELNEHDAETCFYLGSAYGRIGNNEQGLYNLNLAIKLLSPSPNEMSNIYSEMAFVFTNQEKYKTALEYLRLAYKSNATPLLSFKIGQLYDYHLNNKKLAIDYYDSYLTMANSPDTLMLESGVGDKSFFVDSAMMLNAQDRIRILQEELFFEKAKKEE